MAKYKAEDILFYAWEDKHGIDVNEVNKLVKDNPNKLVVVLIDNTTQINEEILNKLNEKVQIRIQGPYDPDRITKQMRVNFADKKHNRKTPARRYYTFSVIYTRNEVLNIIREMEKIEKGMNPNYSDIQKLYYLYDTLKRTVMYDPEYEDKTDKQVRTLRGFINKKTVCAGYSVMLKELLDRQGIESYFLGGHGHAWNVVKIEGEYYPIDITWENKEYRTGNMRTNYFFGQDANEFRKHHTASGDDPHEYLMHKLSSFDPGFVKYLSSTVTREEKFNNTTFAGERLNGEEFMLIQIGSVQIGNETYYKYYLREMSDKHTKMTSEPIIITTKVNLCLYRDKINFKVSKEDNRFEESLVRELLSKSNIFDSLRKGSTYIGTVDSYAGTHGSINKFKKEPVEMAMFPIKHKTIRRKDNSIILVEMDEYSIATKDKKFYKYNIYDISSKNYILRKRIVYSDNDIFKEKGNFDSLFEEDNINEAIRNHCGYLGYFENNEISHKTNQGFFNPNKKVTVEDYDENVRKIVKIPSFEELKGYYQKYKTIDNKFKYDSIDRVEVLERGNKRSVDDKTTKRNAYLALLWEDAVGRGLESFSIENRMIFEEIQSKIIENIKKTNFINTIELYKEFSNDPKKQEIFLNLFSTMSRTRFLTEFFYRSVKPNDKINGEPVTLGTYEFANTLVDASMKRR